MDHVRIDEGVKRGPRKLPRWRKAQIKARDAQGRAVSVIPKDLLPAEVISRYLSDERTADIAQSYGIARSRLNQWLLEHAEESWRKAQVARAVTALERAKDGLEEAVDPLTLARCREQLRGAQWELERLYSRLFGQKQEVTVAVVQVDERLSSDLRQLITASQQGQKVLTNQGEDISDSCVISEVADLSP